MSNALPKTRPIHPDNDAEVVLVAQRMRETLADVLGKLRSEGVYTDEWLIARVRWHLDPSCVTGQVFVAEDDTAQIIGHTIVRTDGEGLDAFGLFSTTYVAPEAHRETTAAALLTRGESWMLSHGLTRAMTYTAANNHALIGLFEAHGYTVLDTLGDMLRLSKTLAEKSKPA